MTTKKDSQTLVERFNKARLVWITVGSLFVGSGSMTGVVWAKGRSIIDYLVQDTVKHHVDTLRKETDVKIERVLFEIKQDSENQQTELLILLTEALPQLKVAAQKRLEQKKASKMLMQAIEGD